MTTKVDNLISSYNRGDITQSTLIKQSKRKGIKV